MDPKPTATTPSPTWVDSDHPHTYDLTGQCTHDGCDRERPLWLTGTTASTATTSSAPTARTGRGFMRALTPATPGRRVLAAVACLLLTATVLHAVGRYLTHQMAEPTGTGTSLVQP